MTILTTYHSTLASKHDVHKCRRRSISMVSIGTVSRRVCSNVGRRVLVRSEDPKVTREYREDDDTVVSGMSEEEKKKQSNETPNSVYADELPDVRPSLGCGHHVQLGVGI